MSDDDIIKDAAALRDWGIGTEDDVRAIGEVTGDHGAPLFIGVYRGLVNVAGVMLGREGLAKLRDLLGHAERETAEGGEAAGLRTIGTVHDLDGRAVPVITGGGTVTLPGFRLSPAQADDLAALLITAFWQAEQDVRAMTQPVLSEARKAGDGHG